MEHFYIKSHNQGFVVDIECGKSTNGAKVILHPRNYPPSDNQLWSIEHLNGGYFMITSKLNGKVLECTGQNAGCAVVMQDRDGGENQQWRQDGNCLVSTRGLVMDIKLIGKESKSSPLVISTKITPASFTQCFEFDPPKACYHIVSSLNGFVIEADANGTNVSMQSKKTPVCNSQLWYQDDHRPDGTFLIVSKLHGRVLDCVHHRKGLNLRTWEHNNGYKQRWRQHGDCILLVSFLGFTTYVIDIKESNQEPGAALILWTMNNYPSENQHFKFVLSTANSLAIAGSKTQNGKPKFGTEDKKKLKEMEKEVERNTISTKEHTDPIITRCSEQVIILLHTSSSYERSACLCKMEPLKDADNKIIKFSKSFQDHNRIHVSFKVGTFGGYTAALLQTQPGSQCQHEIQAALSQFNHVRLIIGLGAAYGVESIKLGDVLVSDMILTMQSTRGDNEELDFVRGPQEEISGQLKCIFCHEKDMFDDTFVCREGAEDTCCKVHCGSIISWSSLLKDKEVTKKLFASVPHAIGVETDGCTLLDAVEHHQRKWQLSVILIKGVAGYAGGDDSSDGWHLTAALAAVEYAHYMLKRTEGKELKDYSCTVSSPSCAQSLESSLPPYPEDTCGISCEEQADAPALSDIMAEIGSVLSSKWRVVGKHLGIPADQLDSIQSQNLGIPQPDVASLECVLLVWKEAGCKPFTWAVIIDTLESISVGENYLANQLVKKYTQTK